MEKAVVATGIAAAMIAMFLFPLDSFASARSKHASSQFSGRHIYGVKPPGGRKKAGCTFWPCHYRYECVAWDANGKCTQWIQTHDICHSCPDWF
jgi:hypothetical protein